MRNLYLSHLVEIADVSRQAITIKQNLCCLLRSACLYTNVNWHSLIGAHNLPVFFLWVSFTRSFKFTLELAIPKHAKAKLAGKVVRKSYLCLHVAGGYEGCPVLPSNVRE